MQDDIRDSEQYNAAALAYRQLRAAGTGQVNDASQIHACGDQMHAVFTAKFTPDLESEFSRVCRINLRSAEIEILTTGPHTDHFAKYAPEGQQIAFLSDRHRVGDFQLYLLPPGQTVRPAPV